VNEPLPHVLDKMPTLPPGCQRVIEKATAKRKEDRYPTAAAMAAALSVVAQSVAAPPKNTTALFTSVKPGRAKAADKRGKPKASPGRKPKTALDKSAPAKPRAVNTEAPTVRLEPDETATPLLRLRSAIRAFLPHLKRPVGIMALVIVLGVCLLAGAAAAAWLATTVTPRITSPTSPTSKAVAVVNVDNVHVREGPGASFDEVAIVTKGDRLEVRGRNEDSKWLAVTLPDQRQGWIAANTVTLSVDIQSLSPIKALSSP